MTRIDSNRRTVLRDIPLDGRTPTGLAFGFRALWVAHGRRGQVSSIDPQFNEPSEPIDVAGTAFGSPNGSVTIGEDSVWAAFGDGTLARSNRYQDVLKARAGLDPAGIVVGSGSVWVSNHGSATVTRYNPAALQGRPAGRPVQGWGRADRDCAGDRVIWVANNASNSVTRIDPDSG